jgi:16S rRNA (cytosine967-C5)-methyltransferase
MFSWKASAAILPQTFCAVTHSTPERNLAEETSRSTIAPARTAAAHVLLAVERGSAHADDQLRSPRVEALSRQDRDLTTELVMGTLRWQAVLDREIAARLRYPESDMHFLVIIALRLGAYQLLFLDRIPAHAAVNDSVELAKQADGPQMAGLVNAVLRRLMRERVQLQSLRTEPSGAYPRWLVSRWQARYGNAATQAICAFGQQPAPATLRLPNSTASVTEANTAAENEETGAFLAAARSLRKGEFAPDSRTGARLQDEASQLIAELAALQAANAGSGSAMLDACAAPGGKTAILAERNPTCSLTAMDISAPRLRIMQRRVLWNENRAEPVHFIAGDASMLPPGEAWDTILCDVPCSGTGTLARNPEIRHRLEESSLARQSERQRAILASALRALRPGGRLVYSTCSLEPEENEQVVEVVLASRTGVRVLPIQPQLDILVEQGILTAAGHTRLCESALAGPYLRTIPGVHPCDGFFAALLAVD